jgi:TonB-linked SusC/RagA family outer membrane protein
MFGLISLAQQRNINGVVSDSEGHPVPGVGVLVKGTSTGTVSILDGTWQIRASKGDVLVFSCLGYATIEVTVGDNSFISVTLKEDTTLLEETVVVGYATMKKRDLVGAVDHVDSKTIANRPASSLGRSLQGQIAGLNVTFTDGKPSRAGDLNVRGVTSIGAGGSSLILIDGVEGDLNSVNPQDVASVSVLKDASSTAVYGARGAFGVILITTKNPEKGVVKINYGGSMTANRRTVIFDNITDSCEWFDWWVTCYNNYYQGQSILPNHVDSTVPYSQEIYNEIKRRNSDPTLSKASALTGHNMFGWAYYDNFDWYKEFYKDISWATEHNISVSGGTDKTDYYVSGRYYDQEGVYSVGNENFHKFDIRAKGSIKVRPWMKITNNMSLMSSYYYQPTTPRDQVIVQRWMQHACYPQSGPYNPDGTWTTAAAISGWAAFVEGKNYRTDKATYFREKIEANIDVIKNVLNLKGDYSINYTMKNRIQVQNPVAYSKRPGEILYESQTAGDRLSEINYNTVYQAANIYATYNPFVPFKEISKNHSLTLLAGWNVEWQDYKTLNTSRTGFTTDAKTSFNLMDGPTTIAQGGNAWSYAGAFGRVNYSFLGRYLLEVSARYDGSSKFPVNKKWGFFPSGSLGWRLSDESWMQWASPVVSNAKIRISAGSIGNGNVAPYLYTSDMSIKLADDYVLSGAPASYATASSIVPVSLTWETATTYDAGIDLDLFNNRFSFTGDYYIRNTTDMYTISATIPAVYGATAPKGNNAELLTRGWELALQWKDQIKLFGRPLTYNIKATLWDSRSFVTKFAGNDTKSLGTWSAVLRNHGNPSQFYEGMEIGEMWGWTIEGIFHDLEDVINHAVQNGFLQSYDKVARPGQLKVKDLDKNGIIDYGSFNVNDPGDLSIVGNNRMRYMFGFNLGFNWNGIGISAFFQGSLKYMWYPGADCGYFWGKYARPYFAFIPSIHSTSNPDVAKMNEDNTVCLNSDTAYWPKLTTMQSNSNYTWGHLLSMPNNRYMQNAAFVRLKNLQIDYTLPAKWCEAITFKSIKVFFNGENLFCFTPLHKYAPNLDPEGLSYDSDFLGTQDGNTYPVMKTFTLGVNLSF